MSFGSPPNKNTRADSIKQSVKRAYLWRAVQMNLSSVGSQTVFAWTSVASVIAAQLDRWISEQEGKSQ